MGTLVDLIIIAIIGLSTFLAYKKGFVNLVIGLFAFLISAVITFILYQPISNLIINVTSIDETIENVIYEKANEIIQKNEKEDELAANIIETAKNEMLPETARNLAINIVTGVVIIILFVAIKIALRFISSFANAVAKLPILEQLNKAGGVLYGIIRGILILYVLLMILKIPEQINPSNAINESVEASYLGKTMYQNNILNVLF